MWTSHEIIFWIKRQKKYSYSKNNNDEDKKQKGTKKHKMKT